MKPADAKAAIAKVKKEAVAELAEYPTSKAIVISDEIKDKNGEAVKVLIIDRDAKGWRRIHVRRGLPISFDATTKQMITDDDLLYDYMSHMANIDLDDDDNLVVIGQVAKEEARAFVLGFFLLSWASSLSSESETGS